jgi:hypothetical protein
MNASPVCFSLPAAVSSMPTFVCITAGNCGVLYIPYTDLTSKIHPFLVFFCNGLSHAKTDPVNTDETCRL